MTNGCGRTWRPGAPDERMPLFRCLYERKKSVLVAVGVYCILHQLIYKHIWKGGVLDRARTLSGFYNGAFLLPLFNHGNWSSTSDIVVDRPLEESTSAEPLIAVGCAVTSRKLRDVSDVNIGAKFQFFHTFLPTFCRTGSPRYSYRFYVAFDASDRVFSDERLRDAFRRQFEAATASGSCRSRGIVANLSLVECSHAGKPTWAQNDAMLEAYLDHVDYLYRVNDDTRMLTGGWTEKFISTLEAYDPPRVGVVGPKHSGGNVGILTYDFVHRTHVDVFGFYYPRLFTDWWGDNWITRVYKPNRSTKISSVLLVHTLGLGQRYPVRWQVQKHLDDQLTQDVDVVNR